ncbi:MAG TPA: hypothetical protein VLM37_02810, partial [Fibrobacteraceae bacterium]|nr:hypothetical protein [Fibrobacteraceae bacterium]
FSNFVNWSGTDMGIDLYNITESSGNICFTTTSSVSVTNCVVSSTATSSSAVVSSSSGASSSVASSSSGASSSSALSSSGTSYANTVSLTTSSKSGDTVQTVAQGDTVVNIIFKTTNGTAISVSGLENTGLSSDTATSGEALRLTISGIASGSAATYSYTVTASASGYNDSSLTGSITITPSTMVASQASVRSQIQVAGNQILAASTISGTKTLQILNGQGQLLRTRSFATNSAGISLGELPKGVVIVRLFSGDRILCSRVVPVM